MITRFRSVWFRPGPVPSSERLNARRLSLMACTPGAWDGSWPCWVSNTVSASLPTAAKVSLTLIGVFVDFSLMHPGPVNFGPAGVGLGQFDMTVGDDRLRVRDRTDVGRQGEVVGNGEVDLDVVGLVDNRGRRADLDTQQRHLVARIKPDSVGEFGAHRPGVFGHHCFGADNRRCRDRRDNDHQRSDTQRGPQARAGTPTILVISSSS